MSAPMPMPRTLPPPPPSRRVIFDEPAQPQPQPLGETLRSPLVSPLALVVAAPADPPPVFPWAAILASARTLAQRAYPRTRQAVVAYAAAAAMLVLTFYALVAQSRDGQLRIAVATDHGSAEKVEIFVDGKKRCDVAPCLIGELEPGPKMVRVIAAGFVPAEAVTVNVEPGVERFAVMPLGEPLRR
jgi:serine/threonine-protein kinase